MHYLYKGQERLNYWIGLSDAEEEGTWVWQHSKQTVDFTYWHTGEPSNNNGNGDCVQLVKLTSFTSFPSYK